ncbi:peroxisome proliferator-activated receptor gamma coactivator-related protein 1 isoform X2 [Sinocyclocheilus rhinocerous]|uniref:peroxisome proliferator-activated receptor gamma coactivator-related protein 1 isoform X2 n=1 Tax=Sinocyclocheilus rhinocerous TaxID=307959 RepID=UPI0007B7BCF2|nr:PREDICTED: peroxisome proliferator-activated receptor gamma coactivator-related protein 1-like isoform X2 [Sinocyclocheilus rhinocerous]
MAAPHGVKLKDLKCDLTDYTAAQAHQDSQVEFVKRDVPVFELDVGRISDALHGSLDPSILSIFQEKTPTNSMESEASLLSALTEMLDSVDVETLSPFDTLPDAEIFSAQKGSDHTLRNLLHLSPSSPDRPKISQSAAVKKSGREVVMSDRQLRPRRHLGTQSESSQRGDDEKKSRSVRTYRIESDPIFPQDCRELLADLVRHMHPYCVRTEKETRVSAEEEEEGFVDVEGYEEQEESILDRSGKDSNPNATSSDRTVKTIPKRSALVKTSDAGRVKKTVTFALNLISVHEIPPDDEEISESTSCKNNITSSQKPKALSLDQYRLLRQKQPPLEDKRMDFRTKWPSLPELPNKELPPILDPNTWTSPSKDARKAVGLWIDPPNPVLVPLKPTRHTNSEPDARVSCEEGRVSEVKPETLERRQKQTMCGEIGIEAADLTSLLEQFETRGLTPPGTPPHQIWRPLASVKGTKHESIKPSPSKTIQIIEPRPLPRSKTHSKPSLPTFTPALNPARAFLDHDYCGIQGGKTSFAHTVLLSPDSSPCRMEAFEEAESQRGRGLHFSSHSPSLLDRGRLKRRGYECRYRRSNSSSCSSSSSSSSRSRSPSPPRTRYRSRHSGSSSSSRSSSRSPSCSPPRKRGRRCSRSRSRSLRRSRSGSRSPEPDWRWTRRRQKELNRRHEEARKQQKAIEERRVVYVGGIRGSMSPSDLKDRFSLFGKVEDCTVHLRSHGDNYGFITYHSTDDAYAAIESGGKLRRPDELPFDICFGGRRQFCKSNYSDLDSNRDVDPTSRSRCESFDFDTLLKQAQRGLKS